MKKRSITKKPKIIGPKTRELILSDMIGTLAGLEYQLAISTHATDILERISWLEEAGAPDITPENLRDLATLRAFIDRTRKGLGAWRVKLTAMQPALFAATNQLRERRAGLDHGSH